MCSNLIILLYIVNILFRAVIILNKGIDERWTKSVEGYQFSVQECCIGQARNKTICLLYMLIENTK